VRRVHFARRLNWRIHATVACRSQCRWVQNPNWLDNLWMLKSAARFGGDRITFICLWNGQGGDGPGGAQHFMQEARRKTTRIYWLDTRQLWD
jgi:hypothetical protein